MRYMGGKHRQGTAIAKVVGSLIRPGQTYYEPFCGAMGSAVKCVPVVRAGKGRGVMLSDVSEPLVTMWKAAFDGWVPPPVVTNDEYNKYKTTRDPSDPMTAYCGFGLSFGGKWFGGYARDQRGSRDFSGRSSVSIVRKAAALSDPLVDLRACDYRRLKPRKGSLIYVDPPYIDRTKAHSHSGQFNHDEFYDHIRGWARDGHTIILTGFIAPADFVVVYSWGDTVVRHHATKGSDGTNEAIFMHRSQVEMLDVAA